MRLIVGDDYALPSSPLLGGGREREAVKAGCVHLARLPRAGGAAEPQAHTEETQPDAERCGAALDEKKNIQLTNLWTFILFQ